MCTFSVICVEHYTVAVCAFSVICVEYYTVAVCIFSAICVEHYTVAVCTFSVICVEHYTVAVCTFSVICNFLRTDLEEQHCIFCFRCGKTASKMNETRETNVGGSVMERTQTSEWFSCCKLVKN
jgi:hypothetical protein